MNIDHCKTFTALGHYLKEQAIRPNLKQAECKQLYSTLEDRCQHHYLNSLLSGHRNWYICEDNLLSLSTSIAIGATKAALRQIATIWWRSPTIFSGTTFAPMANRLQYRRSRTFYPYWTSIMTFPKRCWAMRFCI